VHIDSIAGDGNCLLRALSNAVTRSQTEHDILRLYVTSYMAEPEVAEKLRLDRCLLVDTERQRVTLNMFCQCKSLGSGAQNKKLQQLLICSTAP